MANRKNDDGDNVVLNAADGPIVADSITPLPRHIVGQSFAMYSWILASVDILF